MEARGLKRAVIILSLLLWLAVVAILFLYDRARRPLFHEYDRPLIERTLQLAAGETPDELEFYRRHTFPVVMELPDQTCVELRSVLRGGSGSYLACYDRRTRRVIVERETGPWN